MEFKTPYNVRKKWRRRILRQRRSGWPVKTWCNRYKISYSQFLYWEKNLKVNGPINEEKKLIQEEGSPFVEIGVGKEVARPQNIVILVGSQFAEEDVNRLLKKLWSEE